LKSTLLIPALLAGQLLTVTAQEANQQQRPRRVNGNASKAPSQNAFPSRTEEVDDGDVVRVDTQLVSVPAVVTTVAGRPVAGLKTENFKLFENGQLQRIADFATTEAPFEIALLLDTSGSTRNDIQLIREAARSFIDGLREGDRVAIVGFGNRRQGPSVDVLSRLTDDREQLRIAIDNLGSTSGTPFYDGLERIADEVFAEPAREEVMGRRALVALTDGVDSTGRAEFETARAKLLRSGVAIYFIQVNTEEFVENALLRPCDEGVVLSTKQLRRHRRLFQPRMRMEDITDFCEMGSFERMQVSRDLYGMARREMNELAKASGGRNFLAATLGDAREAFRKVAAEIGTQYSLGYYPTNKARDGKFRTIKVEVQGVQDKAQVRAREGYYAPKG
ncbi:MAG: VWA domain-containing protein, partial [Acidobacteria bacterium]|nr:VWA domain-containing protein [Acidobacteriota bacterium]